MSGCPTCDGYELVDTDGDGVYDSPCPDCNAAASVVRCRVHGRRLVDGRCRSCGAEAVAAELVFEARRVAEESRSAA